jgi:sulfhydrogenase subunit beta (sulfur reductase)
MTCRILKQDRLSPLLAEVLQSQRRLIAPLCQGNDVLFGPVTDVQLVEHSYVNTKWPVKEWLFPRSETILGYHFVGSDVEVRSPAVSVPQQVIFGVRPCDAAGLLALDAVFGGDTEDEFYTQRRAATTVVGVSCSVPAESCFCTAVGLSPTSAEGSDMLLTPLGDEGFLVEVFTAKGEQLLWEHGHYFGAAEECAAKEAVTAQAIARMSRQAQLSAITDESGRLFEHPLWAEAARKCVGCGVCAYVCPTCHCFDIMDDADAWGGERCRVWDSCAFDLFTRHASGHNPRPAQDARYRQRVMHKFSYFPQAHGRLMCVGCGRCVRDCPVNLDIYAVALAVAERANEKPR